MKIGRRNMLGLMATAPLAAPKLAGEMRAANFPRATSIGYAGETMAGPAVDERSWLQDRLSDLRRDLTGVPDYMERPRMGDWVACEIDALRSVSPAYKRHMMLQRSNEFDLRERRWHLNREIDSILQRLKVL